MTTLWEDGLFLGLIGRSSELLSVTRKVYGRPGQCIAPPLGKRRGLTTIELVRHPPWRTSDGDPNMDGEMPDVTKIVMTKAEHKEVEPEITVPKRVHLTKEDLDWLGYTSKCPGCKSILMGTTRQGHTETCRKGIEGELKNTQRLERAQERGNKFFEEVISRDEKKRKLEQQNNEGNQVDADEKGVTENMDGDMLGVRGSGTDEVTMKKAMDEIRDEEAKTRRSA